MSRKESTPSQSHDLGLHCGRRGTLRQRSLSAGRPRVRTWTSEPDTNTPCRRRAWERDRLNARRHPLNCQFQLRHSPPPAFLWSSTRDPDDASTIRPGETDREHDAAGRNNPHPMSLRQRISLLHRAMDDEASALSSTPFHRSTRQSESREPLGIRARRLQRKILSQDQSLGGRWRLLFHMVLKPLHNLLRIVSLIKLVGFKVKKQFSVPIYRQLLDEGRLVLATA